MIIDGKLFHVPVGHLYVFFGKMFIKFLSPLFFKNKFIYLFYFIFGCIGFSLLHVGFSLVAASGGYSVAVCGLLIVVASLVAEHGL